MEQSRWGVRVCVRGVPGAALVEVADNGTNGDWTDDVDNDGLYDFALGALNNAQVVIEATEGRALGHTVVVWLQGETDGLHASVHEADYARDLSRLYTRLQGDIGFDAFLLASIGYTTHAPQQHTAGFVEVMDAQDAFASRADLDVVLASRAAMLGTRTCLAEGLSTPGCGLVDTFHYKTSLYETLGADIARQGWDFVTRGARNLGTYRPPALAITCVGETDTEHAIVNAYNAHCNRCPDQAGLDYWAGVARTAGVTTVVNDIQTICDDFGFAGWDTCRRQSEAAALGECPAGWGFLPTYSYRCFQACQE